MKQISDGNKESTSSLFRFHGEVEDTVVDAAVHPTADARIRLRPGTINRTWRDGTVDVAKEAELPAHGCEEGRPLGVV